MKDIEFRVWDKINKVMRYDVSSVDFENKKIFFSNGDFWYKPFNLMQYIGLKDLNGKKIYEGDVIQGVNRIHEQVVSNEVFYLRGCFMFGSYNAHEFFNRHQYIEVIGNIYDNPELLADVR